ncbi:MAG: peptidylprolyl isomerase, partial [Pseudomonadota bacterium]
MNKRHFFGAVIAAMGALGLAACGSGGEGAPGGAPVLVDLETEGGVIRLEIDVEAAPVSAGDFLRYVDDGRYANAGFYRVVRPDNDNGDPIISVVQGGVL